MVEREKACEYLGWSSSRASRRRQDGFVEGAVSVGEPHRTGVVELGVGLEALDGGIGRASHRRG